MRNLFFRIITSLLLLPVVFSAFIFGGYYLAGLLGVVSLLACLEASNIILPRSKLGYLLTVIFWAALFLPVIFSFNFSFLLLIVPAIFVVNGIVLFSATIGAQKIEKLTMSFYWSFYIIFAIACVYWLAIEASLKPNVGLSLVFLACISTWSNDTFAYFGGRFFGKHRLFERVSSKKTWEGFFAGALGTVIVVLILSLVPTWGGIDLFKGLTMSDLLWVSLPSLVLSPMGDLIESRFKRLYDTKDSSNILPGHGGVLDRIDGLLMVMPWTSLYAFIIRPLW
jgi:phosphatidate cytidylyltransferase